MGRRKKNARASDPPKRSEPRSAPSNSAVATVAETPEKANKNSPRLLNVHARLTLPLLELNENNLLTDSDDEETLEFEIRPRFVYSCNMCLVCMDSCDVVCESCGMVSYCSTRHREENRTQHEPMCKVLANDCSGIEAFRFAKDLPSDMYRSFRIKMIDLVEERMKVLCSSGS